MVDLPSSASDVRLGHYGSVLVSCFLAWPNAKNLAAIRDAQRALAETHPRVFTLTIIPNMSQPGVAAPNAAIAQLGAERDESIKASISVGKELEEHTAGAAMVILSRGLVAVMIRTFMAGLSLVSNSKFEVKVFKTLEEAEAWFRTVPNAPHVPRELAAKVTAWLGPAA